jgi:hypothetical protein
MAEQFISCPSCGRKIELTEAFTREIEQGPRTEFDSETNRLEKEHAAVPRGRQEAQGDLQDGSALDLLTRPCTGRHSPPLLPRDYWNSATA